jgi:hypothetical protein
MYNSIGLSGPRAYSTGGAGGPWTLFAPVATTAAFDVYVQDGAEVPEPSTLLLTLPAMLLAAGWRRYRPK